MHTLKPSVSGVPARCPPPAHRAPVSTLHFSSVLLAVRFLPPQVPLCHLHLTQAVPAPCNVLPCPLGHQTSACGTCLGQPVQSPRQDVTCGLRTPRDGSGLRGRNACAPTAWPLTSELGRPGTEHVMMCPSQRYRDERDVVFSKCLEDVCVCVRALTLPWPIRHFRGFDGLFGRTRAFLLEAVRGHSFAEFLCADHRAVSGGGTEEAKVTWM